MPNTPAREQDELEASREALQQHKQLLKELMLEKYEPIAIVGAGIRFPGGNDTPEGFTEFLRAGGVGTGPIPESRWNVAEFASGGENAKGKILPHSGGFLDGIDRFDPRFFNISPKEAQYIDPQQRLVLETAWEALEHANIDPTALRGGNGGVYVGISCVDYTIEIDDLAYDELDANVGTGTAHSVAAGRISYFLGMRGPSMAIDTACSSSLVALHLAVEGLRRGECEIALCGGVNAIHHPRNHIVFSQAGMLSPDGMCKTFDDSADGYSRAEGCGMVVLKRLSDALRDGDRVIALVRGTAVRQDGESGGLTVPNGSAQEQVMRAALGAAMLEPGDVSYVEAHGTGTSLGDPIEMGAINGVFSRSHTADAPLVVGSLKSNIGHMEAAAGIGGVVKAALQLQNGEIYPHLHADRPSSHIPWANMPVEVPNESRVWAAPVRRALINSFGFQGTIASAVLEQPPAPAGRARPEQDPSRTEGHVFTLSAKGEKALALQTQNYRAFLARNPDADLADLCYTGNIGRAHFGTRLAGVVRDRAELEALLDKAPAPASDLRKVALLFTGQGSQYPGMGRSLYEAYPVFREHLDACDRLFTQAVGRSVKDLVLGTAEDAEVIHETRYTQPALFALEYATAKLWLSWGIEPSVLIGHSIGEVVAAAIGGLFSLEDAVRLVAARARLMQSVTAPGGMVAVTAPAEEVAPLLEPYEDVSFAAFNAPGQCVVSGGTASLAEITAALTAREVKTKALPVSHAFHSPLMHEVFDAFREVVSTIDFRVPELTLVSNLTGAVADPAELATPEYWVRHIGEPVDFSAGMAAIGARGRHAFIEVGPAATLLGLGRRILDARDHVWVASTGAEDTAGATARKALTDVYAAGLRVDWAGYHAGRPHRRVPLPRTVFDRKRYWLPINGVRHSKELVADASRVHHPLLGQEITDAAGRERGVREFAATIAPDRPAQLADHVVMGQVVFPGAGYVEILLALQDAVYGETGRPLEGVDILEPLILTEDQPTEVRTRLTELPDGGADVEIVSRVEGSGRAIERRHAVARIAAGWTLLPELEQAAAELSARAAADTGGQAPAPRRADDLYADFADLGLEYGPEFRRIELLSREGDGVAVAQLLGRPAGAVEHMPPSVLDNVIQSLAAVLDNGHTYLPVAFGTFQLLKKPKQGALRSLARITSEESADGELTADLVLLEGDRPLFVVRDLGFKRVANTAGGPRRRFFHTPRWTKRSLVRRGSEGARRILVVGRDESALAGAVHDLEAADVSLAFAPDAGSAARAAQGLAGRPTDVAWFWRAKPGPVTEERLRAESEANYRDLLALLASLEQQGFGREQRLWLVTEGAQRLPGDVPAPGAGAVPASSLWGFGLSLWSEYPTYKVTLVDLPEGGDARSLADEWLAAEAEEFQIGYRAGNRHVRRLRPVEPAAADDDNFELTVTEYGEFANIRPVPLADVAPQGDEVQVQVHAAGLNFKDVLNALGLLKQHAEDTGVPYQRLPLGFEGSGTVLAAGPDAEFAPGDEVVLSHLGCMKRRVTVPSAMAVRKPANVGFAEAAGLATAYVTAYYALHDLAGIKAGDKVLVHAAAGGVGQAAVQLVKLAGAEVIATASPRKQALLHAQGVEHVLNSRSPEFAERILEITGGAGVDIVLNSLNKEYIAEGMRALGRGGRFVELGKIGIWSAEQAREARPDVAYHNFDLSEFPEHELRAVNKQILETVAGLLEREEIKPIPTTSYSLEEIEEAFGVLSRGANIGKLVLDLTASGDRPARPVEIAADRTYLITGGLGAIGTVTAERLVALGARHIGLVSRRAVSAERTAAIAAGLGEGVSVTAYQGDIARTEDVLRIAEDLKASGRPLAGVFHGAGVLADMPISAMDWESVEKVFEAKVFGTWQLDQVLRTFPEEPFLVGYSSVASVLGPVAQGNYAAGNAFIDTVMQWRSAAGLPGLSIGWGPWAEVGMAANLSAELIRGIEGQGMRFLKPTDGARCLFKALGGSESHVTIGEFDWDRYASGRPAVSALYREVARASAAAVRKVDLEALRALPRAERRATVNELIRERIAVLLHFEGAEDVPADAKFTELGLDSLVAVELKNALEAGFQVPLPTSIVFDYPSILLLAEYLDQEIAPPAADDEGSAHRAPKDVRELSEADADAELADLMDL
ncbi:SDR family NAD(P)-dependent oxidoreductase [Streptomyces virginiae]|uniref:type I polyketide synthase n=1 Tax=Streptomyces virginiae TaxID=1961 RepID=UPI00381175C1